MSAISVVKALMWVLRYIARGMSIVGLAMHGCPPHEDDAESASPAGLTPDELLWQAELAQGDSGAFESA